MGDAANKERLAVENHRTAPPVLSTDRTESCPWHANIKQAKPKERRK